jgi:hypothetical protein
MSEYRAWPEMTDTQKLEFLRELLVNVSRAMLDLREGVQLLYEKSRQVAAADRSTC